MSRQPTARSTNVEGGYLQKHDDDDKLELGSLHRAVYIQKKALARMRRDPCVSGNFRPIELGQLEFLLLEGDAVNVSVLLKKADRDGWGRLRSWNQMSLQQIKRRQGQLNFEGFRTIPLVCFYMLHQPVQYLEPSIDRIGLGLETRAGFLWSHTIWTDEDGFSETLVHPQMPLLDIPKIKLRRPDTIKEAGVKVGTRQERIKREQDAKRDTPSTLGDQGGIA